MDAIPLKVKPTGLPPEEEDRLCRMLERAGEESMRAIGCSQAFIPPKDDGGPIPKIPFTLKPTGLPPEEEDRICRMLEKAAKESMRAIG